MMRSARDAGFSLVEILVGLFVFALASSMAVAMLAATVDGEAANSAALNRVAQLDRLRVVLRDDLGQIVERPVRGADGFVREYVFAGAEHGIPVRTGRSGEDVVVLSFTRRGRANPGLAQARSSLIYVEYRLRDAQLIRRTALRPDLANAADVAETVLIDALAEFELEFFRANGWSRQALMPVYRADTGLPKAVRVRYTQPDVGRIEHIVLTPEAA